VLCSIRIDNDYFCAKNDHGEMPHVAPQLRATCPFTNIARVQMYKQQLNQYKLILYIKHHILYLLMNVNSRFSLCAYIKTYIKIYTRAI